MFKESYKTAKSCSALGLQIYAYLCNEEKKKGVGILLRIVIRKGIFYKHHSRYYSAEV